MAALARFAGRAPDLDPIHVGDLERHPGERCRRLGRVAPTGGIGPDPVADLERAGADPRVESGAAQHALLSGVEDRVDGVGAEVELPPKLAQKLDLLGKRLGLVLRPRHPRAEMVEARIDRVLEERGVARLPAADNEAPRDDPVCGPAGRHPGTIPAGLVTFAWHAHPPDQ